MELEGTALNGVIVLDGEPLPDGTRVRVELAPPLPDDHPHAPYNREKEIAILRESIAEMKAGIGGIEARQLLKELGIQHDLPPRPGD